MDREAELALIERLRCGDAAAFDAVYEAFRRPLFGFLSRLSRRRNVAEELLEETWLRLVTNARRLRPDTRLAPWLFTVARNLYWSYCRSRLPCEARTVELIDLWPLADDRPSPFEVAAAGELERGGSSGPSPRSPPATARCYCSSPARGSRRPRQRRPAV